MSMKGVKLILNNFLLALQLCLGLWQFMKLTPVGALIQAGIGWLLPFGLSRTYSLLQRYPGRVFKRVNCFELQEDISSERREIEADRLDRIELDYLGRKHLLERRDSKGNMFVDGGREVNTLFVDREMRYYITPTIWKKLQTLRRVINADAGALVDQEGVDQTILDARAAATLAVQPVGAGAAADAVANVVAATADVFVDLAAIVAAAIVAAAVAAAGAGASRAATAAVAAAVAAAAAASVAEANGLVLKGHREFWEEVSTGGVMTLGEVLDGLVLYNQRVSSRLNDDWLLPVNLSVSEEKLLKILNLLGVFLQTKKDQVHWLVPTSLSLISAVMEFSATVRVWIYSNINIVFCSTMHLICEPLPRSWRRQIYSLGKCVDNLKPSNDIQLKIGRADICATIAGGAKVDKVGATFVAWLEMNDEENPESNLIQRQFPCNSIDINIRCTYFVSANKCRIRAPQICTVTVDCKSRDDFRHLITFVSSIAKNGCGSLKSCDRNGKVTFRGFRESILSYVKNGFPRVYELNMDNVVIT